MKNSRRPLAIAQPVVQRDRLLGWQYMCTHAMVREQLQGLRAYMKPVQHALRQHDRGGVMIKQLSDVGGLYPRFVSGPGLVPIPFPRSAWENLGIP